MAAKDNYKKNATKIKCGSERPDSKEREKSNSFGTLNVSLFYFIVNSALGLLMYCNAIELEQGIYSIEKI